MFAGKISYLMSEINKPGWHHHGHHTYYQHSSLKIYHFGPSTCESIHVVQLNNELILTIVLINKKETILKAIKVIDNTQ